jgi:hypothetical protein
MTSALSEGKNEMMDSHEDHGGHHHGGEDDKRPTLGSHGQLIVGEGPIYLSHLPMFMFNPDAHPHNFQTILEVTFRNGGTDPQAGYIADRRQHPGTVYTLRPDSFDMIDLVAPEGGRPLLRSFQGLVVRGHFERSGRALPGLEPMPNPGEIPANMTVDVAHVVALREFQPDAEPLTDLEYLLFGAGDQLFAAHVITRPPDFDQVLSVRIVGAGPGDDVTRSGVRVAVPGRPNVATDRLRPGERVTVEVRDTTTPASFQLETVDELYLEEDELSEAMN